MEFDDRWVVFRKTVYFNPFQRAVNIIRHLSRVLDLHHETGADFPFEVTPEGKLVRSKRPYGPNRDIGVAFCVG